MPSSRPTDAVMRDSPIAGASRQRSYAQAIQEALAQAMRLDPNVFVMGQLVNYKSGVFGTTSGLVEEFGAARVNDYPVAESSMTGLAVGAALQGLRPVLVHQRIDFMMYAMDQLVNWAALWRFKSGGTSQLPLTIRTIVGKGWGQGPQHSKSFHAWFAHLPGIKVVMPATAFDAKGLLLRAIFDDDPVLVIEHRSLFSMVDAVPAEPYQLAFGKAKTRLEGEDLTMVAFGYLVPQALRVAQRLREQGIRLEVIDPRTVSPLDTEAILTSVDKTRRLLVLDPAWRSAGLAAEVIAAAVERLGDRLRAKPRRITLPDTHTPTSAALEAQYYPTDDMVCEAVQQALEERIQVAV